MSAAAQGLRPDEWLRVTVDPPDPDKNDWPIEVSAGAAAVPPCLCLTPAEARYLATLLLVAADAAEREP